MDTQRGTFATMHSQEGLTAFHTSYNRAGDQQNRNSDWALGWEGKYCMCKRLQVVIERLGLCQGVSPFLTGSSSFFCCRALSLVSQPWPLPFISHK